MTRLQRTSGFRKATLLTIAMSMAFAVPVLFCQANSTPNRAQSSAQSTSTNPPTYEFDVATFKPSKPIQSTDTLSDQIRAGVGMRFSEDTLRTRNTPLRQLIQWAYGLLGRPDDMVLGGPKWLDTDRYDITAKMDSSVADQLKKLRPDERELAQQQMVQALLADRLKLVIHHEPRVFPVYTLTIAKGGSKLHQARPGDTYDKATFPYADKFADSDAKAGHMFRVGGGAQNGRLLSMTVYGFGVSMPALARQLYYEVGLVVQDKTGLTGKYDFTLQYWFTPTRPASDGAPDGQPPDPAGGPSPFTAIQQQLGLKLESTKGPVSIVVIDHVERPSGN